MKIPTLKYLTLKVTFVSVAVFFVLITLVLFLQYTVILSEEKKTFEVDAERFFNNFSRAGVATVLERDYFQNETQKNPENRDEIFHISDVKNFFKNRDSLYFWLPFGGWYHFYQNFYKNQLKNFAENGEKMLENSLSNSPIFQHFGNNGNVLAEAMIFRRDERRWLFEEMADYINFDTKLTDAEIEKLFSLPEKMPHLVRMAGASFLLYRQDFGSMSVFYYNYTMSFYFYYYALFVNAWFIFVIIGVFFLGISYYFSRLVVRPIREQNTSLAMYNRNLAHEIKTPLAVIQSNFEMFDLTRDAKFIASSREELKNIENITDSLLFLVNPRASKADFLETNIIEIISDVMGKFADLNIKTGFQTDEIFAKIDVHLCYVLVKNILQNAYKYSSDKSVKIMIHKDILVFENNIAETLTKKQLSQIEEIFYQIDNSRSSDGYGLGIPMMRKIVEIFGWKMKISSENKKFEVKIFVN